MGANHNLDAELRVMTQLRDLLAGFEPAAQRRILRWAADVYSIPEAVPAAAREFWDVAGRSGELPTAFAELLELTEPGNNADRALLAACWIQEQEGQDSVDGRSINKLLKEHGIDVSNVTNALTTLIERRPRLVIQAGKKGKFEKLYRVTTEGRKAVRAMMERSRENG